MCHYAHVGQLSGVAVLCFHCLGPTLGLSDLAGKYLYRRDYLSNPKALLGTSWSEQIKECFMGDVSL